jgi:ADP-ribose pyrophosphatase YjhB (NUDIX family)
MKTLLALCIIVLIVIIVLCQSESQNDQLIKIAAVAAVGLGGWAIHTFADNKPAAADSVESLFDESSSSESSELSRKGNGEEYEGAAEKKKPAKKAAVKPKKEASTKASKSDSKSELVACGVIPVTKDHKKVLLVQTNRGMWSFPRAHLEGKEKAVDVAIRAANEAVGLKLKEKDLSEVIVQKYSFDVTKEAYEKHLEKMKKREMKPQISGPGMQHREQHYYVAEMDEVAPKLKEGLKDAKWMTWTEATKLMADAEHVSKQADVLANAQKWASK